jgi:hypothetical protein
MLSLCRSSQTTIEFQWEIKYECLRGSQESSFFKLRDIAIFRFDPFDRLGIFRRSFLLDLYRFLL